MNTAGVDLNLLRTFHAMYTAGSVSRAAEQLGLSQPTLSHCLSRLRILYKRPAVRARAGRHGAHGQGRPSRAPRCGTRCNILDVAIQQDERYDPAASARTFRLHMSDIGETIFLPPLLSTLAARAPDVRLEAVQLDDKDILPALESGHVDLALGYIPVLAGVERAFLLHEHYVVLMRADHPLAARKPTRAALASLHYVLVRSHPATARALDDLGLTDNIRLSTPHFMVLPRIVAETDLAVLMPARLAAAFAPLGAYALWRPRVGLPAFDVSVHWYWRFAGDPGNRWLRELIVALFGEKRGADRAVPHGS